MESGVVRCLFPEEYLTAFHAAGVRSDGRRFHGGRRVTLNVGSVSTANGSSLVRFGDTMVICGVKAELVVATPSSFDKPLVCNLELPSCSSSSVYVGPPTPMTQALTQYLQTTLQKCVDVQQLVISGGKFHWILYVDIVCLCEDGNLLDSCCLAATAALKTTLLPRVQGSSPITPVASLKESLSLKLVKTPLFVSFALLTGNRYLLDPSHSEEQHAQGSISYCFGDGLLMQLTHTGVGISSDIVLSLCKVAQDQAQNLTKLLNEAIQ